MFPYICHQRMSVKCVMHVKGIHGVACYQTATSKLFRMYYCAYLYVVVPILIPMLLYVLSLEGIFRYLSRIQYWFRGIRIYVGIFTHLISLVSFLSFAIPLD